MNEFTLHSSEAEKSYLGALLFLNGKALRAAIDTAREEWFFRPAHRLYFRLMRGLVEKNGALDPTLFRQALMAQDALENTGGEAYIIEVAEFCAVPSNWKHYAGIVRENWIRREVVSRAEAVARDAREGDVDLADILNRASLIGDSLSMGSPAKRLQDVEWEETPKGVTTGFEGIDELIECRGYACGQMAIIQADTNVGKTAFMVSSLVAAAQKEFRCLYATFADLDASQLARRIMRNLCGWSSRPRSDLLVNEQFAYDEARRVIRADASLGDGLDIEVYDAVDQSQGYDVESFIAWLNDIQRERPFDICFVDYAQEITSRDRAVDSLVSQMQVVAGKLNKASRALKIPLVVGSQVTVTDKQTKTMYSRAWEQKAGLVIEIPKEQDSVLIKKNRFGPKDQSVPMTFNGERVRFEEAA